MRPISPTSTLSLLLFLQLASGLPFHLSSLRASNGQRSSCFETPSLEKLNRHTPPPSTPLSDPHFPQHQLSPTRSESAPQIHLEIDKTHLPPTSSAPPTESLAATRPLSSSFLLSLANPASRPTEQHEPFPPETTETDAALPSKPSSALPALRQEDAERYWASLRAPEDDHADREVGRGITGLRGAYIRITHTRITLKRANGRGYEDMIVVGIVLLFLICVVSLESLERVRERSLQAEHNTNCGRRGEIFLRDDEASNDLTKRPFFFRTAPPTAQHRDAMDEKEEPAYWIEASDRI